MRRYTIKYRIFEAIALVAVLLSGLLTIHIIQFRQVTALQQSLVRAIQPRDASIDSAVVEIEANIADFINRVDTINALAALFSVFIIILLGYALNRSIVPKILALKQSAESLSIADETQRVGVYARDELGDLGRSFDAMVNKLKQDFSSKASEQGEKNEKLSRMQQSLLQSLEELDEEKKKGEQKIGELERTKTAMLNLLEDVQAEKAAAEESRASQEAILASIPDGVCVIDRHGNLTMCNPAGRVMFDLEGKDYAGRPWHETYRAEDMKYRPIDVLMLPTHQTLKTGKGASGSLYILKKDGKLPVSVTSAPIIFEGDITGAVSVFRDITELVRLDQAKSGFVSVASHQLRTPLTAINWFAETLVSGDYGKLPQKIREPVDMILQSSRRMTKMIRSLLNVSRIEMGQMRVAPVKTQLTSVVNEVLAGVSGLMASKQLKLSFIHPPDLPEVVVDPDLIKMIVQNLVVNAVHYTPAGGSIAIHLKKRGKEILASVTDTGIGIPEAQQGRIFEKLFRGDNAIKVETDGAGLGLYITKSAVEASGGKIWFTSKESEGTTFSFTIPLGSGAVVSGNKPLLDDF